MPPAPAPQAPLTWTHEPAQLVALTNDAISQSRQTHDQVAAQSNPSFDNVFLPIALSEAIFDNSTSPLSFYQNVSTSKELRDASNEAEKLVRDYEIERTMRLDVYEAMLKAKQNIEESGQSLAPEEAKIVKDMIRDGRRAGLALPEDQRNKLKEVRHFPFTCRCIHPECSFFFCSSRKSCPRLASSFL